MLAGRLISRGATHTVIPDIFGPAKISGITARSTNPPNHTHTRKGACDSCTPISHTYNVERNHRTVSANCSGCSVIGSPPHDSSSTIRPCLRRSNAATCCSCVICGDCLPLTRRTGQSGGCRSSGGAHSTRMSAPAELIAADEHTTRAETLSKAIMAVPEATTS
jgi:hypothetical protein